MKRRSVVIHGHFYQPPREDPWTDRVPVQPSAAPHRDWNQRIHDECYRAVVAARILDGEGRIARVMNTLEWMSWDAGPTLLRWLEREKPATYRAFLEADARSVARIGFGGAMATPYHHVILPLASRREKVTEVRWGIADFRRRFGREPEGMWLPEAAVDTETLDVLAREGIRFTVLAPQQVVKSPDGGLPGRVSLSGGRSIEIFVYDGLLSHDVAFGALLEESARWVERMAGAPGLTELVSIATDGETFGHHHKWADMALAATLRSADAHPDLLVENFSSFLSRHGSGEEVTLVEPSAWSCSHGVDRWRSECGCKLDPSAPTSQAWRAVLRGALAELADGLHRRFQEEGGTLLSDPWAARDEYGGVLDSDAAVRKDFVTRHAVGPLDEPATGRALQLLEMERDILRMDTSCAWFFDDIARVEPLQNLAYAAHALDLLGEGADVLEEGLVRRLARAVSNDEQEGDGARLWRTKVRGGARDVGGPEQAREAGRAAAERAVADALDTPTRERVDAALGALEAAPGQDLFDVQTSVARYVSRQQAVGPELTRLAARLGVATPLPPPHG
jgi:alpha-amylase/alpha-mannosidase (GH57 family)